MSSRGWFWILALSISAIIMLWIAAVTIHAVSAHASTMMTEREYDAALDRDYGAGYAKAMHKRTYQSLRTQYGESK